MLFAKELKDTSRGRVAAPTLLLRAGNSARIVVSSEQCEDERSGASQFAGNQVHELRASARRAEPARDDMRLLHWSHKSRRAHEAVP